MHNKRLIWSVAYAVSFALLVVGAVVYVHGYRRAHHAKAVMGAAMAHQPYPVSMSTSGRRTVAPGASVPIGVQALTTKPVMSVAIWDGPRLVATLVPPNGRAGAYFSWPALTPGAHLLVARVTTQDGQVSESPPQQIQVASAPRGVAAAVPVAVTAEDTLQSVATRWDVPLTQLLVHVPAGKPVPRISTVRLGAGYGVSIEPTLRPVIDITATKATVQLGPVLTAGPQLQVAVDGCSVSVTARGGSMEVDEGSTGFVGFRVAKAALADGSTFEVGQLPVGTYLFEGTYAGTNHTAPAQVTVPTGCLAASGWTGSASLSQGVLLLPSAYENFHLYLTVDDRPALRIPQDPAQGLSASSRLVDISHMIPGLPVAKHLHLEVWSGTAGTAPSVELASGDADTSSYPDPNDLIGAATQLTLTNADPSSPLNHITVDATHPASSLRWYSDSTDITHVVWQVLSVPLTANNTDILPFGLLAVGRSKEIGAGVPTGYFAVDAKKIPTQPATYAGQTSGAPPTESSLVSFAPGAGVDPDSAPSYATVVPSATGGPDASLDIGGPAGTQTVWVRAIAMGTAPDGTETSLGDVSNLVELTLPSPPGPSTKLTPLSITALSVPAAANQDLAGCVRVTHAPWLDAQGHPLPGGQGVPAGDEKLAQFYDHLGTYCLSDYPPPSPGSCNILCQFASLAEGEADLVANGLSDLWDEVAAAYDGVVSGIESALAKFNPVCLALQAASSSAGSDCVAIASIVATAVVSAALSAVGLPPTLPSSSELEAIADGDLTAAAVGFMEELGVPCDGLKADDDTAAAVSGLASETGVPASAAAAAEDPCTAAVGLLLGGAKAQLLAATNSQTAAISGLPDASAVDGFVMVPEPNAHLQGVSVKITADHPSGPFDGFSCTIPVDGLSDPNPLQDYATAQAHLIEQGTTGIWSATVVMIPLQNDYVDTIVPGARLDLNAVSSTCLDKGYVSTSLTIGPPRQRV